MMQLFRFEFFLREAWADVTEILDLGHWNKDDEQAHKSKKNLNLIG